VREEQLARYYRSVRPTNAAFEPAPEPPEARTEPAAGVLCPSRLNG
jgi:hypothetical protein